MGEQVDAAERRERALQSLISFATVQHELGRHFARARRMHSTDATAIVEVLTAEERGEPLTPARLADRIGLSTGATSTLLNRLEEAGHLVRSREHQDRRVVTLHSTQSIHDTADAFFAPLSQELHAVMREYSPDELDLVTSVADRLRKAIDGYMSSTDRPD